MRYARVIFAFIFIFITACNGNENEDIICTKYRTMEDFIGKSIAIGTGSAQEAVIEKEYPGINLMRLEVVTDMIQALASKQCEAVVLDGHTLKYYTLENKDLTTSFTAVAATINNIGPGLNEVGPTGNFHGFSLLSKYVFIFDMLAGRLELFPMLLLFAPDTWKK